MRELPVGTVTFVFTDIEGSTRLLHELGEDVYAAVLAEHHLLLREAFEACGGVEVDNQGDGFLFVFERASDAVAAAERAQVALAPGPVVVRMGLHTGEPRLTAEGYVGLDVHRGSRIGAVAHGGQVLLSRPTRELVEADVLDLGEHRLKDFAEPEWLFQLGRTCFPPLRTISNTNLPRPVSSFIGRAVEVGEVVSLVRGGARLVTLSGPGGVGKTRLAVEAAADLVAEYRNGVFWVGLAALREPALVAETVAQTLGAREGLASHLGERELLLVLDNFEQVVEAAPDLAALLRSCPDLSVLVTSREVLRIDGEVEYRVPPLSEQQAVELFCARAQREPDEVVASLCRRLDDLPLAVELAAARAVVLSPGQILDRISDRLDLLRGGRGAEGRQQTLRATMAWSHELLSVEQRRLFARLSVFAGGCTLEAATEVCAATLDGLQSLVERSLLQVEHERFSMLETIREYAHERLAESGETRSLVHRLGEWLLEAADSFDAERRLGQTGSLARLEVELDNIRSTIGAALGWPDDPLALRLSSALGWFWSASGRLGEGLRWTTEALERGKNLPDAVRSEGLGTAAAFAVFETDAERAVRFGLEALELRRALGDDDGVADALRWLGDARALVGQTDEARRLLTESIALREQVGDAVRLARTLVSLAYVELDAGDPAAAVELFERTLELAQAEKADGLVGDTLHSLGDAALMQGDAVNAARFYRDAINAVSADDAFHRLYCLAGLAAAAALEHQVEQAGHLWGAIESYQRHAEVHLDHSTARRYQTVLDNVEGPPFAAAVTLGRALTLEQAIKEALTACPGIGAP